MICVFLYDEMTHSLKNTKRILLITDSTRYTREVSLQGSASSNHKGTSFK